MTLIFSLERHRAVAEAYIRGVQRFVDGGGDPSKLASVASFFVSRVDTEADKRLDEIGGHDELKGKLAIANAKLAYRNYQEVFSSPEWEALEAKGATKQRCLWASTSTKNKAYKDTVYVEELVGPDTVNTMPRELVEAIADHGEIRGDTLLEDVDEASRILDRLRGRRRLLRRRRADARARGRGEVLQVLRRADRGAREEAEAGRRMSRRPTSGASSGSSCGWTPSARRPPPAPAIRRPRCPPPT